MSNDRAVEAVLQALQRQRNDAVRSEPLLAPRATPDSSNYRNPPQEISTKPSMGGKDSLIKARYALTVLRVAQTLDRETAARLIRGLARDPPLPDELPKLAGIHQGAIEVFIRLAAGLAEPTGASQQHLWNAAQDAAKDWLA